MIRASLLCPKTSKGPIDGSQWGSHQPLNMAVFGNGPGLCPALLFLTIWDGDLIGSLDVCVCGGAVLMNREN